MLTVPSAPLPADDDEVVVVLVGAALPVDVPETVLPTPDGRVGVVVVPVAPASATTAVLRTLPRPAVFWDK